MATETMQLLNMIALTSLLIMALVACVIKREIEDDVV